MFVAAPLTEPCDQQQRTDLRNLEIGGFDSNNILEPCVCSLRLTGSDTDDVIYVSKDGGYRAAFSKLSRVPVQFHLSQFLAYFMKAKEQLIFTLTDMLN